VPPISAEWSFPELSITVIDAEPVCCAAALLAIQLVVISGKLIQPFCVRLINAPQPGIEVRNRTFKLRKDYNDFFMGSAGGPSAKPEVITKMEKYPPKGGRQCKLRKGSGF
jgi:hypothetical protein